MRNLLVCGLNWIGDTLMSLPAVQAFRARHAGDRLTLLVKPALAPLWRLHDAFDDLVFLRDGPAGMLRCAAELRARGFQRAYVLPRSFRAALAPALARIPERWGFPGHWRDALLTRVIPYTPTEGRLHQAWEYVGLLAPEALSSPLLPPRLQIGEEVARRAKERFSGLSSPRIALLPGAARGPAKCWPPEHFAALARRLHDGLGAGLALFGSAADRPLCDRIAAASGVPLINGCGDTSLEEWAAALSLFDAVVANDSGGMHLAAAVGTPGVALFGATDPARTAPLGASFRIVQHGRLRDRDIGRHDRRGSDALRAIPPDDVFAAVQSLWQDIQNGRRPSSCIQ